MSKLLEYDGEGCIVFDVEGKYLEVITKRRMQKKQVISRITSLPSFDPERETLRKVFKLTELS